MLVKDQGKFKIVQRVFKMKAANSMILLFKEKAWISNVSLRNLKMLLMKKMKQIRTEIFKIAWKLSNWN